MRAFSAALGCLLSLLGLLGSHATRALPATPPDAWQAEIRRFEEQDRIDPPQPGSVLFIGSSSIRMWTTLADDFAGVAVINRGFGGSEIADATRFADRIVIPYRPRLIILYAGDNDIADGRSAREVVADFDGFVRRIRDALPELPIAFISIKPSPARVRLLATMQRANRLIRRYARSHRAIRYIDTATRMLDAHGQPRAELFGPDGLHMNRKGYALWTSIIAPEL